MAKNGDMVHRANLLASRLEEDGEVYNPWEECEGHEFLHGEIQRDDTSFDEETRLVRVEGSCSHCGCNGLILLSPIDGERTVEWFPEDWKYSSDAKWARRRMKGIKEKKEEEMLDSTEDYLLREFERF